MLNGVRLAVGGVVASVVGLVCVIPLLGAASSAGSSAEAQQFSPVSLVGEACPLSGPVPGLTAGQAAVAEQVVTAALAASGEKVRVARIAVMVAWTESHLQNLGPLPNNDGSLGVFQQRQAAGWGTAAQELNPSTATGLFVRALLKIAGWEQMAPWLAAQAVQRSSFADGSNYHAHWDLAGKLLASVLADGNSPGGCGQGTGDLAPGPARTHGLPAGYRIPPGTGPAHQVAVRYALAQLGKPYVWAAAGPAAFDCSGLTMAAWEAAGVQLVHYTVAQQHEGAPVSVAGLMAGDLVLVPGSDSPGPGLAGHVGIFLGDGLVESAIDPQQGVAVQTFAQFTAGGIIDLRNPDSADR